jgi:hypothetical protein
VDGQPISDWQLTISPDFFPKATFTQGLPFSRKVLTIILIDVARFVVHRTFLRLGKHRMDYAQRLKPRRRFRVPNIFVWVLREERIE